MKFEVNLTGAHQTSGNTTNMAEKLSNIVI